MTMLKMNNGLNPTCNIKWARAVRMGTIFQMEKTDKLIKVSGITPKMKYWHSQEDWKKFYNKETQIVANLDKIVKDHKKYAETIFYEA